MKKMRVFELAKELTVDPKELMRVTKDLAIAVETTMSLLDEHDVERIRKRFEKGGNEAEPEQAHQPAAPAEETVDQRVSAGIIRRRVRKTEPGEETAEAVAPAAEQAAAEQPAAAATEAKPEPKIEEQPAAEPVAPEQPVETVAVKPAEEPKASEQPATKPAETVKSKAAEEEEHRKKKSGKKIKDAKETKPEVLVAEETEDPEKDDKNKAAKAKQVFTGAALYDNGRPSYKKLKKKDKRVQAPPAAIRKKKITIGKQVTVANLAHEMGVKATEVIKILMSLGVMANQNQSIPADEAILVAQEFGIEVEEARDNIREDFLTAQCYAEDDLKPRPPVVTVMGHVDHGKTSLLDAIRSESVATGEAGGITQHIGAYQAQCNGKLLTFIDTPGHEAFTAMRARGAQATDFVVLVVAADDGVMDQTKEAINHAKAAEIPIIVAVNKIDKQNANPQRVKEQLMEFGLVPEEWGGDTIFVEVSALKHTGLDELLEMILLQAEMLEIKACPCGSARGLVLESRLDKARGPMATLLIQQGELSLGDVFVAGSKWGKVRAMNDFRGKAIKRALPGTPIELIGLKEMPGAGDNFFVVPNEKKAMEIVSYLSEEAKAGEVSGAKGGMSLADLYSQVQQGEVKELKLIVKCDVHGTVEAIVKSVQDIDTGDQLRVSVIHSAVGGITENDILLASTSGAIVCGFNVRPEPSAREAAKKYGVDVRHYSIIYDLIEDIKQALGGMLTPVSIEVSLGHAEVRSTFKVPKVGVIAGCMVLDGKVQRGARARLLRDNVLVHEGVIDSLKRFKDDAREVVQGYECGIGLASFNDLKVGDIIEVFTNQEQQAETPW